MTTDDLSADSNFGLRRRRHRSPSVTLRQSLYEWTALALALIAPVCGPWIFGGVRLWSMGTLLFLTFAAGVLFGLRPLFFRMAGHPVFPAPLPVLSLFFLYAVARISHAASPCDAMHDVIRIFGLTLAFWIWADLTGGHHDRWRWMMSLLLLSAALMSLYALILHNRGSRLVLMLPRPEAYGMRASGAFMCPNHFASFIGMMLPVALALILCRDAGYTMRIFAAYALAVIPPALYLTQSRSGWLGALLGIVVTAILLSARRSWRSFWIAVFLAPLAAAAVGAASWTFSPVVRARAEDAMHGNPRVALWKDTVQMIKSAPLYGVGPGGFRWAYPRFWHEMKAFLDPEHAHNETLEAVAEYGAIGSGILAAGLTVMAGTMLLRLRSAPRGKDGTLVAGALGAGTAVLIHSCFDYNLHVFGVASSVVMIAGVAIAGLFSSGTIPRRAWCGPKFRRAVGAVSAAACVVAAVLIARAVAADAFTRRGDAARMRLEYEVSELAYQRAIACEPGNAQPHVGYGHLLRTRATWSFDEAEKKLLIARAAEQYRTALDRNPLENEAEVSLALLYNLAGDRDRALAALRAIVEKAPLHRDNLCRLGLQLKQMGRPAEALDVFRRARQLGSTEMIEVNVGELEKNAAPKP